MAKQRLRFAVGNGIKYGSVWTLSASTNTPDVYLSCNNLGSIHVSLHKSGFWHLKFGKLEEKIATSFNKPVVDAYMERWRRPLESRPRITIAIRIHTPLSILQKRKRPETKPFLTAPSPKEGMATELLILLVAPNTDFVSKNNDVLGKMRLCNGEQVIVVYTHTAVKKPDNFIDGKVQIPDFTERIKLRDLFTANFGIVLIGSASDGSRMLWDMAIKVSLKRRLVIARKRLVKTAFATIQSWKRKDKFKQEIFSEGSK